MNAIKYINKVFFILLSLVFCLQDAMIIIRQIFS